MFNTFADVLTIFTEYPIPSEGSSGNLTPLLVAVELDTIFKCLVNPTALANVVPFATMFDEAPNTGKFISDVIEFAPNEDSITIELL